MRFTTTKHAFARAVAWVWQAVDGSVHPFAEVPGVGLEVTGEEDVGEVRVVTADRGTIAQVRLQAEHPARGRAVVPGGQLTRVLSSLPARGQLQVSTEPGTLYLRVGQTVCSLRELDNKPLPPFALSAASTRSTGVVAGAPLAEAVKQVATSAADEDVEGALTAIRLGASRAWLSLVATDRSQLALRELPWSWPHDHLSVAFVPAVSLARLVAGYKAEPAVRLCFEPERLTLHTPTRRLTLPHVHGDGVSQQVVERLLTSGGGSLAIVSREELRVACRQLKVYQATSLITRPGQRHHDQVELCLEPGQIRVRAQHEDIGRGEVILKADYTGVPLTVHLAYSYLLRAINQAGHPREDLLEIEATSPTEPVWIRGQHPDGCTLLTMPLLVQTAPD